MAITYIKGNIFNTKCQTIVNTVNCVGIMGKGIALVYKLRYPDMFNEYVSLCEKEKIQIGKVWLYKNDTLQWVLNFPTKTHWKFESKAIYLEQGLQNFIENYKEYGITSIAFPLLGTHNGGLDTEIVNEIMIAYLSKCDIPIEIYEYDPNAEDDLYINFKSKFLSSNFEEINTFTKLRKDKFQLIFNSLNDTSIKSMVSLLDKNGLGINTIQKCFDFVLNSTISKQTKLF